MFGSHLKSQPLLLAKDATHKEKNDDKKGSNLELDVTAMPVLLDDLVTEFTEPMSIRKEDDIKKYSRGKEIKKILKNIV